METFVTLTQLAASIAEFGFVNAALVDSNAGIVARHGRLLAARQLGLREVPVIVLDHLSPAQRDAYLVADNRLAESAGGSRSYDLCVRRVATDQAVTPKLPRVAQLADWLRGNIRRCIRSPTHGRREREI